MSKQKAQWTPLYKTELHELAGGSTVRVRVPLKGKIKTGASQPTGLTSDAEASDSLPKVKRMRPDQVSEIYQSIISFAHM
jgi:hypothetical protein